MSVHCWALPRTPKQKILVTFSRGAALTETTIMETVENEKGRVSPFCTES